MSGSSALRVCMIGLVLLNLVFVQLTEAAGMRWLAPLYALTLLSPLFAGWRENLVYRGLWNAGVLAIFALLVSHATGDDLRYVLEDGLVLAALCQVHLLNNLRSEQRPDLLFLNSFLIAIITGYLCRDLAYPFSFLLYVPLFVAALQLHALTRRGDELNPVETRAVVGDGLRRAALLLGATILVFLFWPRNFDRRGLLTGEFDFKTPSDDYEIGFTNKLKLDQSGNARVSDRVVMRVTVLEGASGAVPALWRGATLASTNGEDWWPASESDFATSVSLEGAWTQKGDVLARARTRSGLAERADSAAPADGPRLEVEHVDPEANVLFTPLQAREVRLGQGADPRRVHVLADGSLRYGEPLFVRPTLHYEVRVDRLLADRGGRQFESDQGIVARYTALPKSRKLDLARALAAELAARVPEDGTQAELVTTFADHLAGRFEYLAPGAEGAAKGLDEFLSGAAGGHCEFFASSLAVMLRSQGVPCRLATGYRSREWDVEQRVLTFRRRDAHAWVEALDPEGGWYAVDPTPAGSIDSGPGAWDRLQASIGILWSEFAGFDANQRSAVQVWLRELPLALWRYAHTNPIGAGLSCLALGLGIAHLVATRRRRTVASVRSYTRALRRARLRLTPGETPRELLERAQGAELPSGLLTELERATREHERARYAA